jgi:hypothetical protein
MSNDDNTETKIITIESLNSRTKLSTILIWLLAIGIGVVIGSVFSPNIPYIGNKEIQKLEQKNKELNIQITNRNNNILLLEKQHDSLVINYESIKDNIIWKDSIINIITYKIDSVNNMVILQDSIINNIYDERYKDINNVNSMDIDERVKFFSNFFKSKI